MSSIRTRVATWTVVGVVGVLIAASLAWYGRARVALVEQFDRTLRARLVAIAQIVEPAENGPELLELELPAGVDAQYGAGPDAAYLALWADGSGARTPEDPVPLLRSPSLGSEGALPRQVGTLATPACFDLVLPDGREGRAGGARWLVVPPTDEDAARVTARIGSGLAVDGVVATSRATLDEALDGLLWSLLVVGAVMTVAAAAAVHVAVGRGLAPLVRLGQQVAELDPQDLPERLPLAVTDRELLPLVARIDGLLQRVRGAIDRERRTSSALAHELCTPIAELRSLTDVALQWPEDDAFCRRALREANGVALQMGDLVAAVLALARAEAGERPAQPETFDLAADVDALLGVLRRRIAERGLRVALELGEHTSVHVDRGSARIICSNLLWNAVEHASAAPAGSSEPAELRIVVDRRDDVVRLSIRNPAAELAAEDLPHLTERFWRKDDARTARDRSGLGLALARELCERICAPLEFALDRGELVAEVFFTAAAAAAAAAHPPES